MPEVLVHLLRTLSALASLTNHADYLKVMREEVVIDSSLSNHAKVKGVISVLSRILPALPLICTYAV